MAKLTSHRRNAIIFGGLVPVFAIAATHSTSNPIQMLCGVSVGVLIGLAIVSLVRLRRVFSGSN